MIRSFLLIFDVCFGFVFIRGIMLHLLVAQHYTAISPKSPVVFLTINQKLCRKLIVTLSAVCKVALYIWSRMQSVGWEFALLPCNVALVSIY